MARKNKRKNKLGALERNPNLPTNERILKGDINIRNNMGRADEPLRIDKLLKNQIIDEMQHLYGLQIITLWTIASRPFIKAIQYERTSGGLPNFEIINLSRMSAEDQFYKTMNFMRKREHDLICKICFEELGAIEAGRSLGLPVNSITVYVRAAFDALGNALAQMRDFKKDLESPKQDQHAVEI